MKNLKKKLAKKAGFTLVELIVVIAILAILAAVAVPAYTGYIQKAQESKVYSSLDALKTAVVFTATEKTQGHAVNVTKIEVTSDGTYITVKAYYNDNNTEKLINEVYADANGTTGSITALFNTDNQKTLASAMKNDAKVTNATWYASAVEGENGHDQGWVLSK